MKSARTVLSELYLDYFNNYFTVAAFAEHNELSILHATQLIRLAKRVHESVHPEA